ncbi:hypothetical protein ABIE09_000938 [Lysobacter enzymogenes]|uniref:hypothetical protein n=1 Tax=Lysobacter enzymogenes TaxID=69 RepID=UPI00339B2A18
MADEILVQYCKAADYNASTGECLAPFYGPKPSFPPVLDAAEGFAISVTIIGSWGNRA